MSPVSSPQCEDGSPPATETVALHGDGAGIVFWILIGLAICGMAPCLILPAWREYQEATVIEKVRETQLADAHAELKTMTARLDAIHNDPIVIDRLARRELGFHKPDELVLLVPPIDASPLPQSNPRSSSVQTEPLPAQLPLPLARVAAFLPGFDYDRIFCRRPAREMVLALSIALFIAAFTIFWPKPLAESLSPQEHVEE
ncbi:MAG: hypothetical protein GXP29_12690 [Planctomycetes bacterium]|nr:hypothetical protein [Planctomycetota bacterium]